MKRLLLFASLFILSCSAAENGDGTHAGLPPGPTWNCRREGPSCNGNSSVCNTMTGECECEDGLSGYDCTATDEDKEGVDAEQCDDLCLHGGKCKGTRANPNCYCPVPVYGSRCQHARVTHTCYHDSMEIQIVPPVGDGKFRGRIYVEAHEEECTFALLDEMGIEGDNGDEIDGEDDVTDDGLGDGNGGRGNRNGMRGRMGRMMPDVYRMRIPYDATADIGDDGNVTIGGGPNCGEPLYTTEQNETVMSYRVLVQYSAVILSEMDERYRFSCGTLEPGSNITFDIDVIGRTRESAFDLDTLDQADIQKNLNPIDTMVLDGEGNELGMGAQYIGTPFSLKFKLRAGSLYEAFRVEKLVVVNGMSGKRAIEMTLIDDGCVLKQAKRLVTAYTRDDIMDEVSVKMKVFKILFSNTLTFRAIIKLCQNDADCEARICNTEKHLNDPIFSPQAAAGDDDAATGTEVVEITEGVETSARRRRDVEGRNGDFGDEEYPGDDERADFRDYEATILVQYPTTGGSGNQAVNRQENRERTTLPRDYSEDEQGTIFGNEGRTIVSTGTYCIQSLVLLIVILVVATAFLLATCCCVFYCVRAHHQERYIKRHNDRHNEDNRIKKKKSQV